MSRNFMLGVALVIIAMFLMLVAACGDGVTSSSRSSLLPTGACRLTAWTYDDSLGYGYHIGPPYQGIWELTVVPLRDSLAEFRSTERSGGFSAHVRRDWDGAEGEWPVTLPGRVRGVWDLRSGDRIQWGFLEGTVPDWIAFGMQSALYWVREGNNLAAHWGDWATQRWHMDALMECRA